MGERYRGGTVDDKVFVYAAGGYYYPGKNISALQNEIKKYLDLGYTVVKIKIGGESLADDIKRIEAVIKIVGTGSNLAVDANGRFDLKTAIEYARALRPYGLFWYEEAGDPLDYALQAELGNHYNGSMATGENLFSMLDARNLIRHGGMRADRDRLQFDCALSYGLVDIYARFTCSSSTPGRRAAVYRTAVIRCPSISQQGSDSAAMNHIRMYSSRLAASPITCRWKIATSACPTCRVSGSRRSRDCMK